MRHHLQVFVTLTWLVAVGSPAPAQVLQNPPGPRAAMANGRVDGIVTDQSGATIDGVSVLALGTALAMVRTDGRGRFSLLLPPGQYVLRATRDGYVSTYREPVRIQSDVALRRSITLTRMGTPERAETTAAVQPGSDAIEAPLGRTLEAQGDHAHTETAWRLRHLPRTALRDVAGVATRADVTEASDFSRATPVNWLVQTSARAATAFFTDTNFRGQVNLLATSARPASGAPGPEQWGRGIAYVVLGAPVGSLGDWSVRAAVAPGEAASWAIHGEYQARDHHAHAFRTGVSYSIQSDARHAPDRSSVATAHGTRRVGGVYAFDHWTVRPNLTVDYGGKIDRYDYLAAPTLMSGRVGLRAALGSRVAVVAEASPRMAAPGADQFLPPLQAGAWIPPERTFTALGNGALRPERVEHYEMGVDAIVTPGTVVTLRTFSEASRDQIATLFGIDEASQVGHYYVATSGSVDVNGIAVGLDTQVSDYIRGRVVYTRSAAEWFPTNGRRRLARVAPSLVRTGREYGHDLTTALDATVPGVATEVSVAYRLSTLFSSPGGHPDRTSDAGRFRLDIRQQLPYRPLGQGEFNILISARTLLRDAGEDDSFYDELMTMAPPMQVICGIQMRF